MRVVRRRLRFRRPNGRALVRHAAGWGPLAAIVAVGLSGAPGIGWTAPALAQARSVGHARFVHELAACHASTAHKPTIILVHGAWAGTSSWDGELTRLRAAGYDARAIADPLQGLTSDAASVRDFLKTIRGPVVLVGHSYGGSVITNAAAGLPNVKALVYVDAAAPAVGETNGQLSGATSALNGSPGAHYDMVPYPGAPRGASDLYLKRSVFLHDFGQDIPRRTALRLWATQRPASTLAFSTPSRAAAWKTIPSWYFISTGDRIITPASELSMAHRAHSKITIFHGGSHLTLISHPAAVTKVIGSAICSVQ